MTARLSLTLLIIIAGSIAIAAQAQCVGAQVFSGAACAGDDLSQVEAEMIRIVNDYRIQNGTSPLEPHPGLNRVANRHLADLEQNFQNLTHSWSNCPYDIADRKTWPCITGAPVRLGTGYAGNGFENLFRVAAGSATPSAAVEVWKKSPPHNSLMLNLGVWSQIRFDAIGVAIRGQWAALWVGYGSGSAQRPTETSDRGIGLTLKQLTAGFPKALRIERESSVGEFQKWVGTTADKSLKIEVFGKEKEISESTIAATTRLDAKLQMSSQNRNAILSFLKNIAPDWIGREVWLRDTMIKAVKRPNTPTEIWIGNRVISLSVDSNRLLIVSVRPTGKIRATEL